MDEGANKADPGLRAVQSRWPLRALGLVIGLVSIAYFARLLLTNLTELRAAEIRPEAWLALVVPTAVLAVSNTILPAWGWHVLLASAGQRVGFWPALWVFSVTQIGKYLPGNLGHHLGRVALAHRLGWSLKSVGWTVALENALLVVFATLQFFLFAALATRELESTLAAQVDLLTTLLVSCGLILALGLIVFSINYWRPSWIAHRLGDWRIELPRPGVLLRYFLITLANAIVVAWALHLVARALFHHDESHFWLLITAWLAGWVAGFVVPGLPAGLGVREGIMTAILAPILGNATALALVLVLRLLTTVNDGLVFVVSWGLRSYARGAR